MRKVWLLVLLIFVSPLTLAQEKTHREWFREALAAAEAGDLATYRSSMAEALEANTIPSNRPFMLYHLARARVLSGDEAGALEALRTIWDDDIERLLVFYVLHDPAFEEIRQSDGWNEIASRVGSLELKIEEVRPGLYAIDGAGSWSLALDTADGWLLVDSGYEQAAEAMRDALDSVSTRPVVAVINTHEHEDHVGGNARFGMNGIIVGHPKTLEVLSNEQEFIPGVNVPAKAQGALPTVLTEESLILPAGEERIHVLAIPAHSGSDLAVVFEKAGVIHMGDGFFPGQTERIFPGEKPAEFLARMEAILSIAGDDAIVYSGHSEPVPVAKLRSAVDKTSAIWDWTSAKVAEGLSGDALAAAATEAGHPADWVAFLGERVKE